MANEIRTRLERMVAEDPYGQEAAALLQRLSVFKAPILREMITVLAPKDMPRTVRMQAMSVLVKWGFATKALHSREFVLQDEVQQLFPEDMMVIKALLTHIEFTDSAWWFIDQIRAIGLLAFCQRFLSMNPNAVLRVMVASREFYEVSLLERALAALEHTQDPLNGLWSLKTIADHQNDAQLKDTAFEKMIALYEQRQNTDMQQYLLIEQGKNAKEPLMLRAYEKAVALDPVNHRLTLGIYSTLIDKALKNSQRELGLQYFTYACAWIEQRRTNRGQISEQLARLALMAESLDLYDTARSYYAHAARTLETPDGLWHWAEFEQQQGNHESAFRLFALSMTALRKSIAASEAAPYNLSDYSKLWQIRRQAILDLGYGDVYTY